MNDDIEELLTFEICDDGDELEVHLNEAGLSNLLKYLGRLQKSYDHEHLMTDEWGGHELTSIKQGSKNRIINKVTLRFWPTK